MTRPNIVLFITHDTGRFVAPYGVSTVHTPNCQRLADEGVMLSQSYSTCPLCSPSRAGCVTGRYPHQNGVRGLTGDLTGGFTFYPDERHAARLFTGAGYESVLCGFEHEARHWETLGFEKSICGSGTWHNGGGDLRNYAREIGVFLANRDQQRPFFMQIGCGETHHPWLSHGVRPDQSRGVTVPPYLKDIPEVRAEMAELQGSVRRLDEEMGRIVDALDQGAGPETIFVFTTDHGIDVPRAKGTFYDAGIGVFHFMRYPAGGWGRGRVIDDMISNVDMLPTLLEAAGVPAPGNMAGRSFLPRLEGRPYEPRDAVFAEKDYHDTYDPTRCVRTARHKYIRYFEVNIFQDLRLATMTRRDFFKDSWRRDTVEELYDLQADPDERKNLAVDPAHAEALRAMRRRLRDWMIDTADPLLKGPVPSPFYQEKLAEFLIT